MKENNERQKMWELDRTFTILFLVVTIIIVPTVNLHVVKEQPETIAILPLLYFALPIMLLVFLWWIATFFNKASIRIVCWYGLFYHVVHAFWTILSNYRYLAFGQEFYQNTTTIMGIMWITSVYSIPIIPTIYVYKEYLKIKKDMHSKKVKAGIFIFISITIGLSFLAVDTITRL